MIQDGEFENGPADAPRGRGVPRVANNARHVRGRGRGGRGGGHGGRGARGGRGGRGGRDENHIEMAGDANDDHNENDAPRGHGGL